MNTIIPILMMRVLRLGEGCKVVGKGLEWLRCLSYPKHGALYPFSPLFPLLCHSAVLKPTYRTCHNINNSDEKLSKGIQSIFALLAE